MTFLYSKDDFRLLFSNEKCYFTSDFNVSYVAVDSREVVADACFFAIRGKLNDGHKYIDSVVAAGASLIVCEYINKSIAKYLNEKKINVIVVQDTHKALIYLAEYRIAHLKKNGCKIIAITGSIGKTTTKDNTADLLSHFFPSVYRSPKSYNTILSTPAVIGNAPIDTKVMILEVSMSEPNNQIAFLSKIIKPDIACVTTIAPAHTMNFETLDEICEQKIQICAGLDSQKSVLILNKGSAYYAMMHGIATKKYGIKNILTIGDETSHMFVRRYTFTEQFRTNFEIETNFGGQKESFYANVPGCSYHSASNTLFSVAIAKLLSLDINAVVNKIQYLQTIEGRGNLEAIKTEGVDVLIINESYNSSPEALKAAISSLGVLGKFRPSYSKVAILGDMLELGHFGMDFHLKVVDQIVDVGVDLFIAVGPLMGAVADALDGRVPSLKYNSANDLVKDVRKILFFGRNLEGSNFKGGNLIVLLKGSRGINLDYVKNKLYR